jgi:hypothetical protein
MGLLRKPMFRLLNRPFYASALIALVAFIVYLTTLAPSVDFIDDGELATVCTTLGIAHPTGYPLFTLVGWVFAHLPIASSVILRLNIMAAFFTALGAGAVTLLAYEIFRHWMPERIKVQPAQGTQKTKGTKKSSSEPNKVEIAEKPHDLALAAAAVSGIAAAFSATWWSQSTSIEVYPLHVFMVPMVLTFFLRMLRNEENRGVGRDGKLFALTLGLSFANHMTTAWLAPACLYMFFARYGASKPSLQKILRIAPFFLAGLALYLYLPIRSSMYPPMDWGHPTTFGAFWRHFTGKQYTSVWLFTGGDAASRQFSHFWHQMPHEFTIVGAIVALAGIYAMFNAGSRFKRTHILGFAGLLFVTCVLVAINYDIHDIDSYFLLAFLTLSIWIGAGIMILMTSFVKAEQVKPALAIVLAAALIGVIEIATNHSDVDESGNYIVEDFTKNVLLNAPPHAIIFSSLWDFWVSGAFYYQMIERVRPDVLVIDKAMLRDRPWYYAQLMQRDKEPFLRAKPEMDNFLHYLWAFDRGEPFNPEGIAPAYQAFTRALVEKNMDRPIFITQEMIDQRDDLFAPGFTPVPAGVLYRLMPRDTFLAPRAPNIQWRDQHYRKRNYYTDDARLLQASPLALCAQQYLKRGDKQHGMEFLNAALKLKPDLSVNLDEMSDRDASIAEATNQRFTTLENVRNDLLRK